MVRCALIGVPCDMPAGRKACGFLSHCALLGCTKCLKVFPGSVGNKDYSGFDRASLVPSSLFGFPTREGGRKKSLVHIDCACAGFASVSPGSLG